MYALVGSGEYLPPMDPVDRHLLALARPADAEPGRRVRVACLPTAAGTEGDAMIDSWMRRGVEHFTRLGADATGVRVWDRATAGDAEFAEAVERADLVYLSGGRPSYLAETLADSRVWAAIEAVTERGGMLVGCSAGAMIQGSYFMGGPRRRPGFGLWPGVHVIPHYDEIPAAITRTMRRLVGPGTPVIGVPASTALVHTGSSLRVLGDRVTIWTTSGSTTYPPGELDLAVLDTA